MTDVGDGRDPSATLPPDERIEEATVDDLDAILDHWTALIEHGQRYGLHLLSKPNRTVARETLAAAIADGLAFVARPDDRIVGFCSLALETGGFERDVQRGVVENLYVEPDVRGEGLGSALLAAGEHRLEERGAERLAVEIMVADEDVWAFYEDHGYRPYRLTFEKRVETNR